MATSPTTKFGTESFGKAAIRHFDDAEFLHHNKRMATVAHLYGFAAECGIKWLLIRCGQQIVKPYREHIDKLSPLYNQMQQDVQGRQEAKYFASIPSITDFADWSISHRYLQINTSSSDFVTSCNNWRKATMEVMKMMDDAILDGVSL